MTLQLYLANRWIKEHQTSPREIANLLALADRDIEESQTDGLGPEWRFEIAYNAALQTATAALAAAGYRPERANKHMRVIETLEFTVGLNRKQIRLLDAFRRKRHVTMYQLVDAISSREAKEMFETAVDLRGVVEEWLRAEHPDLLPPATS